MKFGDRVDEKRMTPGAPPIVLQLQPTGYVKLDKPEEIKEFEELMHAAYGRQIGSFGGLHACETCSNCCTDDCGMF